MSQKKNGFSVFRTVFNAGLIALVVAYIIVTIFHFTNGLSFGGGLVGGFKDARALYECRGDLEAVKDFVNRSPIEDDFFSAVGSPYEELCP